MNTKMSGIELAISVVNRNIEDANQKIENALESIKKSGVYWSNVETMAYKQEYKKQMSILLMILEKDVPLTATIERLKERLEEVKETLMMGPEVASTSLVSNGINLEAYKSWRELKRDLEGILNYISK